MNTVEVTSRGIGRPSWLRGIRRYCRAVLAALATEGWELSVLLTSDEAMRDLNRRYRGIDSPTDVLSFSQAEGEVMPAAAREAGEIVTAGPAALRQLAGDIVIALPTAERQAAEAGVPLEEELRRLLVHGILHLKGLDHGEGSDEMLRLQDDLLRRVEERVL
jgi:probable rRNA maturation factor